MEGERKKIMEGGRVGRDGDRVREIGRWSEKITLNERAY